MRLRSGRILMIVTLAILLAGIGLYFFQNREKHYSWYDSFQHDSQEPYGAYMLAELLKDYHSPAEFKIEKEPVTAWMDTSAQNENYVFFGDELFLDTLACDLLLDFIEKGNTAFISAKQVPPYLISRIYTNECGEWYGYHDHYGKSVHANFDKDSLGKSGGYEFNYTSLDNDYDYNWKCITGTYFCDSTESFIYLGFCDSSYTNFMKVPHGEGNFLFHTTPIFFSNYFIRNESGYEYASKALSYLSEGSIHWDDFSGIYWRNNNSSGFGESPLRFILSQQPLRWAWYSLLALTLIYVFFYAKRRQRIIPVYLPNENTSLEFSKIVARLSFQQKQHQAICRQQMQIFMLFLRNRYHVKGSLAQADDPFIKTISLKSGVPFDTIKAIFKKFHWINITVLEVDNNELINFYTQIESFYKTCK